MLMNVKPVKSFSCKNIKFDDFTTTDEIFSKCSFILAICRTWRE